MDFLDSVDYFYQFPLFQRTYDFTDAVTQLGQPRRHVHHSHKELILRFLELRGGAAAASLLEGALTVPLSARQLALPRD